MRKLFLITKEDFMNLIKNPMWIFTTAVFPILILAIMGFMTRDNYGNTITSYDYYGVTMMIYSILSSGLIASNAFMEERIKKPNMRIIYAPGSAGAIYQSKVLASFAFAVICHSVDLVIAGVLLHVHFSACPQMLLLFLLLELFSVTLGIMLCCICKTEQLSNQVLSILINLFSVLGGLFFSLDGLGKWVLGLSRLSPVKWITDTSFKMMYDKDYSTFIPVAAGIVCLICVMEVICKLTFRKEDCIC